MAIEDGVDSAGGGDTDITRQAAHEQFADLAGAPVRLATLAFDDQAFDLRRQLVGIAHRSP